MCNCGHPDTDHRHGDEQCGAQGCDCYKFVYAQHAGDYCSGCNKPCGAAAARREDYDRAYTFNCPECDREYCAICLKDEPGYNADGDCVGDPPTMVDASSWKGFCRKCKIEEITQR
jgi:hypothetical protein